MSIPNTRSWKFSTLSRDNNIWYNTGVLINLSTNTVNNTLSTGTISNIIINKIESGTVTSSTPLTINNASNLYIDGPISAGNNTTISNRYSLYVNTGDSYLGRIVQQNNSVTIGANAGNFSQRPNSVAIGSSAGATGQGTGSIAIGQSAGSTGQGQYCIAIGFGAGNINQNSNSIVLNATGSNLNTSTSGLYINPIRNENNTSYPALKYNTTLKEVIYDNTSTNFTYLESRGTIIQTIPNSSDTIVNFNVDTVNSNWTGSRTIMNRFYPPRNGYYQVNYGITWSPSGFGARASFLVKNASLGTRYAVITMQSGSASNELSISGVSVVYLSTTDYLSLYVWQNSGVNTTLVHVTGGIYDSIIQLNYIGGS